VGDAEEGAEEEGDVHGFVRSIRTARGPWVGKQGLEKRMGHLRSVRTWRDRACAVQRSLGRVSEF